VILSDGEIRQAIADGHIVFTPALDEDYLSEALTTSALDLRLGDELQYYAPIAEVAPIGLADAVVIDPTTPRVIPDLIAKWGKRRSIADSFYDLPSHEFVLGTTLERVELPETACIAARVEGKSTLARLGFVVHMTAPTIHCGYRGVITLEILNFGPYPLRLKPGARICQLIFERVGETPLLGQATQYLDQAEASGRKE
jgi:dCTP deaminase